MIVVVPSVKTARRCFDASSGKGLPASSQRKLDNLASYSSTGVKVDSCARQSICKVDTTMRVLSPRVSPNVHT